MPQFRLFVDSSNGVDIDPTWDYKEIGRKIESRHRVRSGRSYVYKWGQFSKYEVPVTYVSSSFKFTVNDYWINNTDLLFMEVGIITSISSVRVTNKVVPIGSFVAPYTDLFLGTINLETY